jgi:hypothetical protein
MDRHFTDDGNDRLTAEFERTALADDDSAAREILASGMPVDVARDDTPPGHVIRIYPDGREACVSVDRAEAVRILGA